jgi:hypothetical protein
MKWSRWLVASSMLLPLAGTWFAIAKDPAPKGALRIGSKTYADRAALVAAGARCATPAPTAAQHAAVAKALAARGLQANATGDVVIPIQYIHISNAAGTQGNVTEQQRIDQTAVLNAAYAGTGFVFCYDPVAVPPRVTNNDAWFSMAPNSAAELQAKKTLGNQPEKYLNFYTTNGAGLLGWATFPFPSIDTERDGVVCLWSSLPGGSAAPYNEGDTATHEVGHWLGLFHTFQGGCDGTGDSVGDTQDHPNPDFGCPTTGPSCNPPASSPVRNFMNYVDDPCMDQFTSGQGSRMRSIVSSFRPLLGSVSTSCSGGGGGGCLLARLAPAVKKLVPFPLSQDDMDGMRRFRDVVLRRSEAGRSLSHLYYRHGPAVAEILARDPQLAGETLSFLARQLPAVERAVDRNGDVGLTKADYDRGLALLNRIQAQAGADVLPALEHVEKLIARSAVVSGEAVTLTFPTEPIAGSLELRPIADPAFTPTAEE